MMDMLDCLKELILDGKSVRLGDLGLFSIGMSSRGEVSRDKVTSASVQDIHLLVKNTKNWSNAELKKLCKITAYDARGGEETAATRILLAAEPARGGTNGGGSGNTQEGGGTSGGTGSEGSGGNTVGWRNRWTEPEAMAITSTSLLELAPSGATLLSYHIAKNNHFH